MSSSAPLGQGAGMPRGPSPKPRPAASIAVGARPAPRPGDSSMGTSPIAWSRRRPSARGHDGTPDLPHSLGLCERARSGLSYGPSSGPSPGRTSPQLARRSHVRGATASALFRSSPSPSISLDRRASHRASLAPSRDKSILRVAASLQDETHPFASEVASEARLSRERRLASSNSDHPFSSGGKVLGFVLPPSLSLGQRPPFGATPRSWGKGATRRTWEEQDDEDVDPLDTLRFGVDVDSDQSSDDIAEAVWARRDAEPETDAMAMEMDMDLDIDLDGSGAGPSASTAVGGAAAATPAAPRPLARPTSAESIWTEFRESRRASATLSTSLALREQNLSASPGTAVAKRPFGPSSLGAVQDSEAGGSESPLDPVPVQAQTPSTSRATTPVVPSAAPSPAAFPAAFPHWRLGAPSSVTPSSGAPGSRTRLGKRKVEDRFEPYATSVYKRRAVSPMHPLTLSSLGSGGIGGPSPTGTPTHPTPGSGTLSAGLLHTRSSSWVPTKKRANSRPRSSRSTSPATATAAAVLTDTASAGGAAINGASGASGARPTTPTSRVMVSPALGPMGVSATPLGTPKMVASTPLAAGSGPGYGSGALGLSLGVNQAFSPGASSASGRLGPWVHRHTEEGQEEEVEEGLSMIDLT